MVRNKKYNELLLKYERLQSAMDWLLSDTRRAVTIEDVAKQMANSKDMDPEFSRIANDFANEELNSSPIKPEKYI